jgi:hypothetical protein
LSVELDQEGKIFTCQIFDLDKSTDLPMASAQDADPFRAMGKALNAVLESQWSRQTLASRHEQRKIVKKSL